MPLDPTLPKSLLHLMEKRQGAGRRKQDGAKATLASAKHEPPAGSDRRKSNRRKPKQTKTRRP